MENMLYSIGVLVLISLVIISQDICMDYQIKHPMCSYLTQSNTNNIYTDLQPNHSKIYYSISHKTYSNNLIQCISNPNKPYQLCVKTNNDIINKNGYRISSHSFQYTAKFINVLHKSIQLLLFITIPIWMFGFMLNFVITHRRNTHIYPL